MNRCVKCGISPNVPGLKFDHTRTCNFCLHDEAVANGDDVESYASYLRNDLEAVRGNGQYDAIACLSGGKDSTYALKVAVREYGLRVLAFTLDNGYLSESAFKNIHTVVGNLGVDHVAVRPNEDAFKEIVKVSATKDVYNIQTLRRISAVCQSCITIVLNQAVTLALEKGAPFIIGGFTLGQVPRGKYGYALGAKQLNELRKGTVGKLEEHGSIYARNYMFVDSRLENSSSTKLINPLCAAQVDERDIIREAEALGWVSPNDVDGCSTNCRLNAVGNYLHERRHGFNPYEIELSNLVRRGLMPRGEMLHKINTRAEKVRNSILHELNLES